jgi:hypothetical protein
MMSMAHNGKEASMSAKPVVAATDGSEGSLRAVGWAAREAASRTDTHDESAAPSAVAASAGADQG